MLYRHLGRSGLKVSLLSLGSWVTYHNQVDVEAAVQMMATAYDGGVNFFDNAEVYAGGRSEEVMGAALKRLGWPRLNYIVSSKYFWGLDRQGEAPNRRDTLNRKYLMQAVDGSLRRMGLEHLDLIYCHRADPHTPLEETVRAMNDIIVQGKALYWGTSEWPAESIQRAWDIAERHGWHRPIVEQPQYNLFNRRRVEQEYAPLYESTGLGLTTWSPLASGLLTGKYRAGIAEGTRGAMPSMAYLRDRLADEAANAAVQRLQPIAEALGCTLSQLAIAWVARNPQVSSVITGASRLEQLRENLGAIGALERMTADAVMRILAITGPLAQ